MPPSPLPRHPGASRVEAVQAPIIPIVAGLIRENPGTLSLGQGVVSYGPPPQAMEALQRGMSEPENHKYRPVAGLPELVEAAWRKLARENGIEPGPERSLMVTAGSNLGFMNAVLAIASPGDEVILQTPYYFNHEMAVTLASAKPVLVPTDERHQLQIARIREAITPRTRAVVTVSPNNPTGAVYPREDLEAVNRLCAERGLYHIHDEAYEYFTYDGVPHFSPGSLPGSQGHTISLFSLSKGFGFASWRIGFMVVPVDLMEGLMKIQDTLLICAPVPSQYAAVGALEAGTAWVGRHREGLLRARESVMRGLKELGPLCTVPPADGAFYFLLNLHTPWEPLGLVKRLVQEHKVAVVPGTAFGTEGCRLRVSYGALTPENAEVGIRRLVAGLQALCPQ
ncbi:MAG TPA: aspartate aminotransferase [Verrucomicrobiales bacterium]|nr:aspartate aminotransferase [Verrucomicrobiales bacterium]